MFSLMPINKDLKFLFIHNPKTGGSTIETMFNMNNKNNKADRESLFGIEGVGNSRDRFYVQLQHLTPNEIIRGNYLKEKNINDFFSFVFVRNTWDKIASSYASYFYKLKPRFDDYLFWIKEIVGHEKDNDFFIYNETKHKKTANTHFKEQYKFCYYGDGLSVDYIGRYENFIDEMNRIFQLSGIEKKEILHINKTNNKKPYSTYYNSKQRDLVNKIYEKDINLFNFKFEVK